MDPSTSASDTRQLCVRMASEARETRITALQFGIALASVIVGLALFAWALILV